MSEDLKEVWEYVGYVGVKNMSGREDNQCKGPEVEACLVCLRDTKEASVAIAE